MTQTPNLKHVAYKGRRYRIAEDGTLLHWRSLDNAFTLAWRPFIGTPELEEIIRQRLAKEQL